MKDNPNETRPPSTQPAKEHLHPDAHTSIEPSLLVEVSREANRDEITGAVARALTISDVPFLRNRSAQEDTVKATELAAESPKAGFAPNIQAEGEPDQSLTINITTQGN